jgi:signal transduction histidine kinase
VVEPSFARRSSGAHILARRRAPGRKTLPRTLVRLEVVAPGGFTKIVPINRTPFTVGSDRSADLALTASGVAPCHARIVLLGGVYHLVPDSSGAPLTKEGVAVPPGGVQLEHGATLMFGAQCPYSVRFLAEGVRTEDREDRLVTLMEIARTITSSLALGEVLDRVLEGAIRFSGAERGYLFLRDGGRLVPWTRGMAAGSNVEVSHSVVEEVARTGRPIYRDATEHDSDRPVTASIVRLRLQAILCLPLAVRGDVIGVVYLDSRKHLPHHEPDLPLLEALAGLAAISIQNTRLVEERVRTERTLVMGQMARAIVHDLRSPLTAIRGLADLLHGRAPEGDPSRPHLTTIISEADRLSGLTGDLLHFSSEAPPPARSPVRLADLVRQTLKPLGARLAQLRVGVTLVLDEEARASVDAPRLVRVLHNLVANSLDAMKGGGSLHVGCERFNGHCVVSVGDSGSGMSEDVQRRIFEPFFSHGKPHGTGLGMAIVRKIVEEHGGTVRVKSRPAQGTVVSIELPAAE